MHIIGGCVCVCVCSRISVISPSRPKLIFSHFFTTLNKINLQPQNNSLRCFYSLTEILRNCLMLCVWSFRTGDILLVFNLSGLTISPPFQLLSEAPTIKPGQLPLLSSFHCFIFVVSSSSSQQNCKSIHIITLNFVFIHFTSHYTWASLLKRWH